jgi:hypothetical protein
MEIDLLNEVFIKYKDELQDYTYVTFKDIKNLSNGCYVVYISKKNFRKKGGLLKQIIDPTILELFDTYKNRRWYIYTSEYFIFYKNIIKNKMKDLLIKMVNSDFESIKKIKNKK